MKIIFNSVFIFFSLFGGLISIFNTSCTSPDSNKNNPDSLTQAVMNRSTVFDPEYFRQSSNYHMVLRVKYESGIYSLADTRIFKVPGKYRLRSTAGDFTVKFMNATDNLIDSITSSPPYSFIKEVRIDSLNNNVNMDTLVFNLSIPPDNNIKKVVFFEKFIQKTFIIIPTDTFDVIQQNATAPLDSTLF